MNELVVPPAPHWYKNAVLACSPDNTLVYGSKNDIVVVKEKNPGEPADVRIIHGAHFKHITSVNLNRKWREPHRYIASLGEDSIIKIWNLDTFEKKTSNKDHTEHKDAVIGAVFAGDDRVISASSVGLVVVWNINTNESKPLTDLFKSKVTLTCLSSCPHVGWLLAFGLSNGGVVVADLRRNGHVLYKLRGHYQSVVSLSWCPAPVNIFPRSVNNQVKNKSQDAGCSSTERVESQTDEPETSTCIEKDAQESSEKELKSRDKKVNPWVTATGDFSEKLEHPAISAAQDFLKECNDLKNKILGLNAEAKQVLLESEGKTENMNKKKANTRELDDPDRHQEVQNRPLPQVFDVSVDFFDDLPCATYSAEIKEDIKSTETESLLIGKESGEAGDTAQDVASESKDQIKIKVEGNKNNIEDSGIINDVEPTEVESTSINEPSVTPEEIIENEPKPESLSPKPEKTKKEQPSSSNGCFSNDEKILEKELKKSISSKREQTKTEEPSSSNESSKHEELIEEEPRTEYLLASSGKDRSVYIWRAGTDGRMQTFFYASKKPNRRDKNPNNWISLCWATPNTIITSSSTGEVLAWPVPKPKESRKQSTIIHYEHSSPVFNIVTPPKYSNLYNWRDKTSLTIWTWGQDGKLVNYDMTEEKIRYSFSTVTATVTSFASSLLDPNRLAVGLRDGGIRVWDLSLPHSNEIIMQKYQQKFTHKVSAISWHPYKEMILGFGTEEGRVGFIDLISKKTTLFPHYFRNQVYKVDWGPIMEDTVNLGLYVIAEGNIAIYNIQKPDKDPTLLDLPAKLSAYNFAWKPDFTILLLNGKDGCLVVLKSDLTAINTLYPSDKGLNAIVWHPDAFIDQTDISPRCNWFAAATTKGVLIFDCSSLGESDSFADKLVASFEGHLKPPLALAWCPFEGNEIVSVAADGLAHVWDVYTKTAISTIIVDYVSPNCSVMWSPVEADLIIIGDKVLRICSVSKNQPKTDEEFLATRKRLLTKLGKKDPEKVEKTKIKVDISLKPKSNPKNYIVPSFYVSNDENISSQVDNMRKLLNEELVQVEGDQNAPDGFQIFGTKEDVAELLQANYLQHKKEAKYKSCELISLWKGSIGEYIRNAINENRVTSTIVTLAPMVSPKLWHDACLSYAKKLSEEANSDPLETAMYFLACHKIEEAINFLCSTCMFKEALALAKHRLPEDGDTAAKVLEKWAVHCTNTGNFENATYCYIANKDYENAAKVLSRRNQKEFLDLAMELAQKAGNTGLSDSIKFKLTEQLDVQGGSGDVSGNLEIIPSRVDAILKNMADNEDDSSESSSTIENESVSNSGNELDADAGGCGRIEDSIPSA